MVDLFSEKGKMIHVYSYLGVNRENQLKDPHIVKRKKLIVLLGLTQVACRLDGLVTIILICRVKFNLPSDGLF